MRYPGTLVVEFLDPLPPGLSRKEFTARVSTAIEDATARLVDQVPAWTGNQIQLVEHSIASFAELVRTRNHLVTAIREDGIALTPTTPLLLRPAA